MNRTNSRKPQPETGIVLNWSGFSQSLINDLLKMIVLPFLKINGGEDEIRTHDPHVANVMLYQLSYFPIDKTMRSIPYDRILRNRKNKLFTFCETHPTKCFKKPFHITPKSVPLIYSASNSHLHSGQCLFLHSQTSKKPNSSFSSRSSSANCSYKSSEIDVN